MAAAQAPLDDVVPYRFDLADGRLRLTFARGRRTQSLRAPVKSAVVAPTDAQYGYARIFQILNDHSEMTVEIFRTEEDARAWLQQDASPGP